MGASSIPASLMLYRKPGKQPINGGSKLVNAAYERGDEQEGGWPRDALLEMDRKY